MCNNITLDAWVDIVIPSLYVKWAQHALFTHAGYQPTSCCHHDTDDRIFIIHEPDHFITEVTIITKNLTILYVFAITASLRWYLIERHSWVIIDRFTCQPIVKSVWN